MADRADPAAATEPLRIGILGAARIAPLSIVEPAAATGHRLVAVAARDASRARAFAAEHGIERVQESYAAVIADHEVEVVYNPLPNSMHAKWNVRAAEAGKHVLSEKPAAMNVEDARRVRDAVAAAGVVFMEAFHYPYHRSFGESASCWPGAPSARCSTSKPSSRCRRRRTPTRAGRRSSAAARRRTSAATASQPCACSAGMPVGSLTS
jgi:hypothetical protein